MWYIPWHAQGELAAPSVVLHEIFCSNHLFIYLPPKLEEESIETVVTSYSFLEDSVEE